MVRRKVIHLHLGDVRFTSGSGLLVFSLSLLKEMPG